MAGYFRSSVLSDGSNKCMENTVRKKEIYDFLDYFVIYQAILIFYVLTILESISFIQAHDREYNKNRMVWDTWFRVLSGSVLLAEVGIFLGGLRIMVESNIEYTRENGPLENSYPSADLLNTMSVQALGLRILFMVVCKTPKPDLQAHHSHHMAPLSLTINGRTCAQIYLRTFTSGSSVSPESCKKMSCTGR